MSPLQLETIPFPTLDSAPCHFEGRGGHRMRLHIESLMPSHCICNTSIPVGKRYCNQCGISCPRRLCTFAVARRRNQHRGESDMPCTHTFLHDTLTVVGSDPRSSLVPNIGVLSHHAAWIFTFLALSTFPNWFLKHVVLGTVLPWLAFGAGRSSRSRGSTTNTWRKPTCDTHILPFVI